MNIVFAGSIGRFPVGGHAWVDLQWLLGLRALGHRVVYLEECGQGSWVYNWETEALTTDLEYPTAYLRECLEPVGFGARWIYRAGERSEGMCVDRFMEFCSRADLLLVRGVPLEVWRREYARPRRRAYIDSDPGFTQMKLASGERELTDTVARCERLFTIGQRIGDADCPIPTLGRHWSRTVSPIFLPAWPIAEDGPATHFTSILQWRSYDEVLFDGVRYGNKDREFRAFIDLPRSTRQPFRLAATGVRPETLTRHGWEVVNGWRTVWTPESYRAFIGGSRAELGMAKQGYVATRGGWFSDRSICYLASGRPVLVQETGVSDWLPVGAGLLTFRDAGGALRGIDAINCDYERHRRAARRLAEEHFATDRVLPPLLDSAMS